MSVSTSILVGTYLECTMAKQPVDVDMVRCGRNLKHHIRLGDKFCSTCGTAVQQTVRTEDRFVSLRDIAFEEMERQGGSVQDEKQVISMFDPYDPEWIGYTKDGVEIVGYKMDRIDADQAHVYPLRSVENGYDFPSHELIEKLTLVAGYTRVEVKCGVIVEIA
jgi:hypothetical protein